MKNRWILCVFICICVCNGSGVAQIPANQARPAIEIHAVVSGPFPSQSAASASLGGALPAEDEILPAAAGLTGGRNVSYYILQRKAIVEGNDFRTVSPGATSNTGQPYLNFTLSDEAGEKLWDYTSANVGKSMAVVMGGTVREAAVIHGGIRDSGEITGSFSPGEVQSLSEQYVVPR